MKKLIIQKYVWHFKNQFFGGGGIHLYPLNFIFGHLNPLNYWVKREHGHLKRNNEKDIKTISFCPSVLVTDVRERKVRLQKKKDVTTKREAATTKNSETLPALISQVTAKSCVKTLPSLAFTTLIPSLSPLK